MKRFLAVDTAPMFVDETSSKKSGVHLLWGDSIEVLAGGANRSRVRARGSEGFVDNDALGDESLLEIYLIDVGQGDGILIRTPDGRHVMIDGGYDRSKQPAGKNAADFVDWKFSKDYAQDGIHLDAMIASHCDADHYGGLYDLLEAGATAELDAQSVTVDAFYHAGVAWWKEPGGDRWLGPGTDHLTQLMGDRAAVVDALKPSADPALQGEWARFMRRVTEAKTSSDTPTPITRLSDQTATVPGFDGAGGTVAIRVLAPVEKSVGGNPALRRFKGDSLNTNGHSLLLRLDYGRARILLTGDLNTSSQSALMEDYAGRRVEFQCDVAKACHHGSDDVSYAFLGAMQPAVTVISSGDSEGHDHPRPSVIAASATTGFLKIDSVKDKIVSPLVYSTELARSVKLGDPKKLTVGAATFEGDVLKSAQVEVRVTSAGALRPSTEEHPLRHVVSGIIYGLVNVRTDGNKILCATRSEKDGSWDVKKITSRF